MGKEFGRARRLELVRAGPALRCRAAGEPRAARAGSVRARVPAAPRRKSSPPSAGDSRRGRRRHWPEIRLRSFGCAQRLGGCVAVHAAVVWRACHQRRRMTPLRFSVFVVGEARAGSRRCSIWSGEPPLRASIPPLVIRGRLFRSCRSVLHPIDRRAPLPDHQRLHVATVEKNTPPPKP